MPVPPANLPRLVPEKPPVLELKDVGVLLKLARAELATGLQAGKAASSALEVLEVIARVEYWHRYESAHRNTRYGATPSAPASEVGGGGPGPGHQGPGDGGSGPGDDVGSIDSSHAVSDVPPIEAR